MSNLETFRVRKNNPLRVALSRLISFPWNLKTQSDWKVFNKTKREAIEPLLKRKAQHG